MPNLLPQPGTSIATPQNPAFSSLGSEVIIRSENRLPEINRTYVWLKEALLEISGNPDYRDDFLELEEFGPKFILTPGTQEYNQILLVPNGDFLLATLDILIWQNPPINTIRRKLNPTHFIDADKISAPIVSLPTQWYRFGASIGFDPTPDKAYQVQVRLLRQHPINDSQLSTTICLLPRDWHDILIWSAVERGFMENNEYEKAQAVHTLLYGDPKDSTKPGLIKSRKKTRSREAWREQQALRPRVARYSSY
jgi:hypothetical protein